MATSESFQCEDRDTYSTHSGELENVWRDCTGMISERSMAFESSQNLGNIDIMTSTEHKDDLQQSHHSDRSNQSDTSLRSETSTNLGSEHVLTKVTACFKCNPKMDFIPEWL